MVTIYKNALVAILLLAASVANAQPWTASASYRGQDAKGHANFFVQVTDERGLPVHGLTRANFVLTQYSAGVVTLQGSDQSAHPTASDSRNPILATEISSGQDGVYELIFTGSGPVTTPNLITVERMERDLSVLDRVTVKRSVKARALASPWRLLTPENP